MSFSEEDLAELEEHLDLCDCMMFAEWASLIAAYREQAAQQSLLRSILAEPAREAVARIAREWLADRYYDQLLADHPASVRERLRQAEAELAAGRRLAECVPELLDWLDYRLADEEWVANARDALAEYERAREGA